MTLTPGEFDKQEGRPIGSEFYVKYRKEGDENWQVLNAEGMLVNSSSYDLNSFASMLLLVSCPRRYQRKKER